MKVVGHKQRLDSTNAIRSILERQMNSFVKLENTYFDFEKIDLKEIAECYLGIKKNLSSVKSMHFDIENKYFNELKNMKNESKKMGQKFLTKNIDDEERGQYFGDIISNCDKVFSGSYENLNFNLKIIKDEIFIINEKYSLKEEQRQFLQGKLDQTLKNKTRVGSRTPRGSFVGESQKSMVETDIDAEALNYPIQGTHNNIKMCSHYDENISKIKGQLNGIDLDMNTI